MKMEEGHEEIEFYDTPVNVEFEILVRMYGQMVSERDQLAAKVQELEARPDIQKEWIIGERHQLLMRIEELELIVKEQARIGWGFPKGNQPQDQDKKE